jgi:hypothetical protein
MMRIPMIRRAPPVLVALSAFFLGIHVASPASKPSTYVNPTYGFTLRAPGFAELPAGEQATVAMFLAPPTDGDTINVNVIVNRASTTRADWVARSKKEFGEVGFTTIAERNLSVNGWDAVEIEYSGALEGNDFHWLSLSVITNDRVYLVTCTASAPAYAAAEKEFRACLQSFAVDAAKPASAPASAPAPVK